MSSQFEVDGPKLFKNPKINLSCFVENDEEKRTIPILDVRRLITIMQYLVENKF